MRLARPLLALAALGGLVVGGAAYAAPTASPAAQRAASHHPRYMPLFGSQPPRSSGIAPPAPPCPIPTSVAVPGVGTEGPCVNLVGVPTYLASLPGYGNMAYWGGPVAVHPHIYLVFLGWGRPGAFKKDCKAERLVEGSIKVTLKCDPDGAGKRMADFVSELGGTQWAGVQSQYYQTVRGVTSHIQNPRNQLGGIWVNDTYPTSAKISYRDMAVVADQARKHFHVKDADLFNSNMVILQPQNFSDPLAQSSGYCAWHDNIQPSVVPSEFHGLKAGLPFTNMPYVLNQGAGCGENMVNPGAAGTLDSFTVALGHEIEETVTDPGAEDHVGENNGAIGGWYDPFNGYENGDKCAYVGNDPTGGGVQLATGRQTLPIPGAANNIKGNRGDTFPVQSLWSNDSAGGLGYCAGAGDDLPF